MDKIRDMHFTSKDGKKVKGYQTLPPDKKLRKKLETLEKVEEENKRMLNWVDVANFQNFETPAGLASIKGL